MEFNYDIAAVVDFGAFIANLDYSDWPAHSHVAAIHVLALEANP